MELYFNEISGRYKEPNLYEAKARMQKFLDLCKRAKKEGFNLIRTNRTFDQQELSDGYKIANWYDDATISKTQKDFFLGYRKFPCETGDDTSEAKFIEATYRLSEPEEVNYNGETTEGLAWAYIRETLAISFPVNEVWKKTKIGILEEKRTNNTLVFTNHASQCEHIEFHLDWTDSLKEIDLIETDLPPGGKQINLRDDHGKNTLTTDFARKLTQSPYVTAVINSLPYNPKARSFIKKTFRDGKIEIVLVWTDEGLGMVVQSTGRNLRETTAIARMLQDKYA